MIQFIAFLVGTNSQKDLGAWEAHCALRSLFVLESIPQQIHIRKVSISQVSIYSGSSDKGNRLVDLFLNSSKSARPIFHVPVEISIPTTPKNTDDLNMLTVACAAFMKHWKSQGISLSVSDKSNKETEFFVSKWPLEYGGFGWVTISRSCQITSLIHGR